MTFQFTKATKEKSKARIALVGPSGSGKTYTSLSLASHLGNNVALIDTENGSASKYADTFNFSVLNLETYEPQTYVKAIEAATKAGFDVLIIDSISHAWMGKGGALEQVDKASVKYRGNSFAAWRDVTPHHNALVDAMVQCPVHLIVTMRAKTAYEVQKGDDGKVKPIKIGLAPVQRDGLEYEFDIVGDMDLDNNLIISKTRCSALRGAVIGMPGEDVARAIRDWLSDGKEAEPPVKQSNGNGHKVSPPKSKDELLEMINRRVEVPYDGVDHLLNAIRLESGQKKLGWPTSKNVEQWRKFFAWAKDHADKKVIPAEQATFTDEPQPTNYDE